LQPSPHISRHGTDGRIAPYCTILPEWDDRVLKCCGYILFSKQKNSKDKKIAIMIKINNETVIITRLKLNRRPKKGEKDNQNEAKIKINLWLV